MRAFWLTISGQQLALRGVFVIQDVHVQRVFHGSAWMALRLFLLINPPVKRNIPAQPATIHASNTPKFLPRWLFVPYIMVRLPWIWTVRYKRSAFGQLSHQIASKEAGHKATRAET
jgi:hypothetical protein